MSTKFIKIAIIAAVFMGLGLAPAFAGGDAAAGIKLSTLTTLSGSVYKQVEVITADNTGLLFRHSVGTAKVDFADLSANLREMFEPAPEEKPIAVEDDGKDADAGAAAEVEEEGGYEELEIETRTRITINFPPHYGCNSTCCNPFDPRTVNWQSHWGRYHYGLSYANFYCRQAAERELLIRSGFLR